LHYPAWPRISISIAKQIYFSMKLHLAQDLGKL
jgi:hypothetical protein